MQSLIPTLYEIDQPCFLFDDNVKHLIVVVLRFCGLIIMVESVPFLDFNFLRKLNQALNLGSLGISKTKNLKN